MTEEWLRVPVGPGARNWTSHQVERTVLAIVHNVTSATRLLDVLALFESDPRVQVVFTWTRSSPFTHDVEAFLADVGAIHLPWDQALRTGFDLAVSASYGGELDLLDAPLVVVSHGVGYNKYWMAEPAERPQVFGLSGRWLLSDGAVVPSSIVLSHPEQLDRLAADCPEAVPAALLAGDPCLDRILASVPWRDWYRTAFGADPATTLVVVTSTWGRNSLVGRDLDLLPRLLAALPVDRFRVALILHPNIWHGHGPYQVRAWLSRCERAGLIVVPPREGWRAALVAADLVIGDHGSVTFYGAAVGAPVLLATFAHDDVDGRSPVAALGRAAPRLDRRRPLLDQVRHAIQAHAAERYRPITRLASSDPGRSAGLLRAELYRLLGLPEPAHPAVVRRVPEPELSWQPARAILATAVWEEGRVTVRRYPAAVAPGLDGFDDLPSGAHLIVDESEEEPRLLRLADVIVCGRPRTRALDGLTEALSRHPGAYLAAACAPGQTVVRVRDAGDVRVTGSGPAGVHAAVVYAWLAGGRTLAALPPECVVDAADVPWPLGLSVES
jgi:hypothetical protein